MLKRWSLNFNLTGRSASLSLSLSLRVAAETLIPSAAVESRRSLSGCLKLRRLLPWIKFKTPSAPPFPPPKRLRKKKSLSKIGFLRSLRKIRLFRRRTILPATSAPTDDECELQRRSLSPRSPNQRKAAAAVASLLAVVVAWIFSERIRRWCGPGGLPGQCSYFSSSYVLF